MATKTNTVSHITYATEWDHVNVAFIARAEIDGDTFERPTEKSLTSKAVVDAARALEKAVVKELSSLDDRATVRTMRQVRDENLAAAKKARSTNGDDTTRNSLLSGQLNAVNSVVVSVPAKTTSKKTARKRTSKK